MINNNTPKMMNVLSNMYGTTIVMECGGGLVIDTRHAKKKHKIK